MNIVQFFREYIHWLRTELPLVVEQKLEAFIASHSNDAIEREYQSLLQGEQHGTETDHTG